MLLEWWVIAASSTFVLEVGCQLLARGVSASSCLLLTSLLTDCEGHAVVANVDMTRTGSATMMAAWESIALSCRSIGTMACETAQHRTIVGSRSAH